jgi:hypothetical protein
LARFEKEFVAAGEARLDADEVIRALRPESPADVAARCRAIAQFLSGKDGWQSASSTLGGAFAKGTPETWLSKGKDK